MYEPVNFVTAILQSSQLALGLAGMPFLLLDFGDTNVLVCSLQIRAGAILEGVPFHLVHLSSIIHRSAPGGSEEHGRRKASTYLLGCFHLSLTVI